jgi:predicted nucleic acid-binding protein
VGWIDDLTGHLVGVDTAPLIYYVEGHPTYLPRRDPFFQAVAQADITVVTSIITLIEVSIRPLRNDDTVVVARYSEILFDTAQIVTTNVTAPIAREAARLRATYNLRTPDAIQLATAITAGAVAFLTNDERLRSVPDIPVLVVDDLPVLPMNGPPDA